MNNREHQTITIANILLTFTLVTVFIKLFSWGWRKSKIGTILVITIGPYLYWGSTTALNDLNVRVSCGIKPNQSGCVEWKEREAIKDSLMKRAIAEQQHEK